MKSNEDKIRVLLVVLVVLVLVVQLASLRVLYGVSEKIGEDGLEGGNWLIYLHILMMFILFC